ncbi:hypothetical protein GR702_04710 [Novosphingobium sp. FGD1]|uniref:DUF2163 domain-containing protein n=1 Tax=Novosphingobium silvae TaxID=2692619 RepID=A0A7X4K6D8_9SPHN|nr:hypothetical protein [Novosphingobium silvae]MYL97074.1 hypothetical protein [Novosphingobium silvae]
MQLRESFALRIETDDPFRMWSGHGDLIVPPDIVESEPALYIGGGELLNAPDFDQGINFTAERIEIQLSGASTEVIRLAIEAAAEVTNARVHFVTMRFDMNWQLVEVEYEAVFRADKISVQSDEGDARSRTITLSIGTEDTNRNRAPMAYFTDQDQRRRSETDAIFSNVSGINQGTSRTFGPR